MGMSRKQIEKLQYIPFAIGNWTNARPEREREGSGAHKLPQSPDRQWNCLCAFADRPARRPNTNLLSIEIWKLFAQFGGRRQRPSTKDIRYVVCWECGIRLLRLQWLLSCRWPAVAMNEDWVRRHTASGWLEEVTKFSSHSCRYEKGQNNESTWIEISRIWDELVCSSQKQDFYLIAVIPCIFQGIASDAWQWETMYCQLGK